MFGLLSSCKVVHHSDRIDAFRNRDVVYPISVQLHPVAACNHRCSFCRFQSFPNNVFNGNLDLRDMMEFSKIEQILDDCVTMGVRGIELSGGGEPSIHPRFIDILDGVLFRGMDLGLITNGVGRTWCNDASAIIGSLSDRATWIRFSLDAASAGTHSIVHGCRESDFEVVVENIRSLAKSRGSLTLGISFVVVKENWFEIQDAIELAADLGVDYIRFASLLPIGHNVEGMRDTYYDVPWYDDVVETLTKAKAQLLSVKVLEDFCDRSKFGSFYGKYVPGDVCYYSSLWAYICADLNLYPCCVWLYHPEMVVGSLVGRSFKELWEGEEVQRFYEELSIAEKCGSCFLKPKNDFVKYLVSEPEHVNFI